MAIIADPNSTIYVTYQATDKDETLTVVGKIYQNGSQVGSDISLTHVADGMYEGSVTAPSSEGILTIVYTTNSAVHETISETISIRRSFRPSFGQAEAKVDPAVLRKIMKDEFGKELEELREAIARKSEFDPNRDMVRTDIKPTSLRPIIETMERKIGSIKFGGKNKDYTQDLKRIEKTINELKQSKNIEVKAFANQMTSAIASIKQKNDPQLSGLMLNLIDMVEMFNKADDKRHKDTFKKIQKLENMIVPLLSNLPPFLKVQ